MTTTVMNVLLPFLICSSWRSRGTTSRAPSTAAPSHRRSTIRLFRHHPVTRHDAPSLDLPSASLLSDTHSKDNCIFYFFYSFNDNISHKGKLLFSVRERCMIVHNVLFEKVKFIESAVCCERGLVNN